MFVDFITYIVYAIIIGIVFYSFTSILQRISLRIEIRRLKKQKRNGSINTKKKIQQSSNQ